MNLKEALKSGRKFWLGPIIRAHYIGEYALLEYQELDFNSAPERNKPTGRSAFAGSGVGADD